MSATQSATHFSQPLAYPSLAASPAAVAASSRPLRLFKMPVDMALTTLEDTEEARETMRVAEQSALEARQHLRLATSMAAVCNKVGRVLFGYATLSFFSAVALAPVLAPLIFGIVVLMAIVSALLSVPLFCTDAGRDSAKKGLVEAGEKLQAAKSALDAKKAACARQLEIVSPTPLSPGSVHTRIARV